MYNAHRGSDLETVSLSRSPLQDTWSSTRVTHCAITTSIPFDSCNVRYTTRVRAVDPWSETFAKIKMTRKPFAFTVDEEKKKQTFVRPTFRHHPSRLSSPPRLGTSSAKCLLGSVTARELSFGRSVAISLLLLFAKLLHAKPKHANNVVVCNRAGWDKN